MSFNEFIYAFTTTHMLRVINMDSTDSKVINIFVHSKSLKHYVIILPFIIR